MNERLATITALALFLVSSVSIGLFLGLGHDEGVTIQIAVGEPEPELMQRFEPWPVTETYPSLDGRRRPPPWRVIKNLSVPSNPQPPGYFLGLNAWAAVFGGQAVSLRIPGLLCGLAALLAFGRLARRLIPRPTAATAVVFVFALSPWFGALATFARPYAPALALGLWSTVLVLSIADSPRRWAPRFAFVVVSLAGLYTLYHYAFVLAWQLLFLVAVAWRDPRRRALHLAHLVGMTVVIGTGFAPWVPALIGHLQLTGSVRSYYKAPVSADAPAQLERVLSEFLVGVAPIHLPRTVIEVTWAAMALLAMLLWVRSRGAPADPEPAATRDDPLGRLALLSALLYPLLILVADLAHGTRTLMISKTTFMALPLLLLAGGRIWSRRAGPRLRVAGAVVAVLLMAGATGLTVHMNHFVFEDDHRLIARHLLASDDENHLVLLNTPHRGNAVPLLLTLQDHGLESLRIVMATPPNLESVIGACCAREGAQRITLLNLQAGAVYNEKKVWTPEQVDAAARHGRLNDWNVVRAPPRGLAELEPLREGERRMLIVSPVR